MTEENPEPHTDTALKADAPAEQGNTENHQEAVRQPQDESVEEHEKTVPLSAHLKERKKRQQLQEELELLKKSVQAKPAQEEDDYSKYESVTREELGKHQFETIRAVREGDWADNYPERMAIVEAELEDFLKQRPNLAPAINSAPNRYKEAWELMQALTPRKPSTKNNVAKQAPGSPGTVPKGAALNEVTDVMTMSDKEFREWAKSKRKRR